jgi:hypothetical protein
VTSARQIAANRRNGRKSCGPRTFAGKRRASRNSLTHGLSIISYANPTCMPQIEEMAIAMCGGNPSVLLLRQARVVAENDLVLRSAAREKAKIFERLHDGDLTDQAKGHQDAAPKRLEAAPECRASVVFKAALLQLDRLERYERRALSRRKTALQRFIEIASAGSASLFVEPRPLKTSRFGRASLF